MGQLFSVFQTYIMFNFVFWLMRRGARTPSRIDPDCAIRSEPVLGREPLPRESRYVFLHFDKPRVISPLAPD